MRHSPWNRWKPKQKQIAEKIQVAALSRNKCTQWLKLNMQYHIKKKKKKSLEEWIKTTNLKKNYK